jgi:hypothetical protein
MNKRMGMTNAAQSHLLAISPPAPLSPAHNAAVLAVL